MLHNLLKNKKKRKRKYLADWRSWFWKVLYHQKSDRLVENARICRLLFCNSEQASDQVGEIKETYISGLTDIKNISSALDFEFDPNQPEVIILEELTILAAQERWLYGLLEEARKASKLVVATSLKIDALEALEKRIR